jgi:hypothetical protein
MCIRCHWLIMLECGGKASWLWDCSYSRLFGSFPGAHWTLLLGLSTHTIIFFLNSPESWSIPVACMRLQDSAPHDRPKNVKPRHRRFPSVTASQTGNFFELTERQSHPFFSFIISSSVLTRLTFPFPALVS